MDYKNFNKFFSKLIGQHVYIGFSGGADSRTLIELANFYKKKYRFILKAINFEHGIRGQESLDDTKFCIDVCNTYDIPIEVISLNLSADTKNLECVAREKRLEYYRTIAEKDPKHVILLGHHLDDKIENFFIRLARGSNLSGLCGFKQNTYIDNIRINRPLMGYSKSEILDFLNIHNITFRTDSTNLNIEYGRNYLRNKFLPDWFNSADFIKGGIKKALQNLEVDNDFIEEYTEEKFREVYKNCKLEIPVELKFYRDLHPAIRFRVLKKHIQLYIKGFEMTNGFIESFNSMIQSYDNTDHKFLKIDNYHTLVIKGYKIYIVNNLIQGDHY